MVFLENELFLRRLLKIFFLLCIDISDENAIQINTKNSFYYFNNNG